MTVVIDCNIFVMCLTSNSPYHFIYQSLVNNKFKLAITVDILLEYEEVLQNKYNIAVANTFIALMNELPNVLFINPYFQWQLITSDLDDNKYCDCAIASQAAHIISEDKHFNVLKNVSFPSLSTIGIDEFLSVIKKL